jgi:hypothetical protein
MAIHKRQTLIVLTLAATALNVAILILNLSLTSQAAVSGMDYKALASDEDFKKAVQTVIEACRVNVDIGKVRC